MSDPTTSTPNLTKDDETAAPEGPSGPALNGRIYSDRQKKIIRRIQLAAFAPVVVALVPAWGAVTSPRLEVHASGEGPRGTQIARMVVKFHGAWWEQTLLCLPYVLMAAGAVFVCRALYRIDVNMAVHTRPFTRRDNKVLRRAPFAIFALGALADTATAVVPRLLPSAQGLKDPSLYTGALVGGTGFMAATLFLVLLQMYSIHHSAMHAYEKLEEIA